MLDDLVDGLFDYAGMFPPASLGFEEALAESAALPGTMRRPAMLQADLVLRLGDVPRLTSDALAKAGFNRPLRLCIVGLGPDQVQDALQMTEMLPEGVTLDSVEPAVDDPWAHDWQDAARAVKEQGARMYIEPRWGDAGWSQDGERFWSLVTALGVGAKFRCAGPTALDRSLPDVLIGAARAGVPLKATQGLHHPHPGPDPQGFLNMVVGLRMAQAGLGREELASLLADDDPSSFRFDPLGWRGHRLLAQRVANAIAAVPFAVGSCSLREPDEELADLHGQE